MISNAGRRLTVVVVVVVVVVEVVVVAVVALVVVVVVVVPAWGLVVAFVLVMTSGLASADLTAMCRTRL